ncbi:hypothetical protein BH10CYA1_BH10CYA1_43460 [soil metagenome]
MAELEIKKNKDDAPPVADAPAEVEDNEDFEDHLAADSEEASNDKKQEVLKPHEVLLEDTEEKARASYLQETVSNLLPALQQFRPSGDKATLEDEFNKFQGGLKKDKEAILDERQRGVFGPATAKALQQYKDWLEKRAIPESLATLDGMKLAIPPGCPITLPLDQKQRAMTPELYKSMAAGKEFKLDLNFDSKKVPSEKELQRIDDTFGWLERSSATIKNAQNARRDQLLEKEIQKNELPAGWLKGKEKDPDGWRASATDVIDLTLRTKNYVEAMQALYKDTKDRYGAFPVKFPPGTKVEVDYHGETKVLTDKDLNDPHGKYIFKDSTIKKITFDLPDDLRQENPANGQKIERMRKWLDDSGVKIDQAVAEYSGALKNPDAIVMFGDQEWPDGWRASFDKDNKFTRMVGPNRPAPDGEKLKDCNIVGYDAKVTKQADGTYKIAQTITAENAPWYAYQNFRLGSLGVTSLGDPMEVKKYDANGKLKENVYKPDDFVPVKDGNEVKLVQAKNLESFLDNQRLFYYGEKALTGAMDTAMLVSGTIEFGVALKSAQLAVRAGQTTLALSGKQLAWELGKSGTRVVVAGLGILNNAEGRSSETGRNMHTARSAYFLGDITQGLARGSWQLARGAKAAETMTSAEKVHTLIDGKKAADGAEILKSVPYFKLPHTATSWTFKATELGYAPIIGGELKHQIGDLMGRHDNLRDAKILVGDGRGNQKAENGSFDRNNPNAQEAARQMMDSYATTLSDGRGETSKKQVRDIFENTKRLLDPKTPDAEGEAYRTELLKQLTFSAKDVELLEPLHPKSENDSAFRLTDDMLHDLMDPVKRSTYPPQLANKAEEILNQKDRDVDAAARIALMYLSRDKDGKVEDQIARAPIKVGEYKRDLWVDGGENGPQKIQITIPERPATLVMTSNDAVMALKYDLENKKLGNRGIVTGDALLRMGGITHQQYGGILQDVLTNRNSSPEDKMRALTDPVSARFATIVDAVRLDEGHPKDALPAEQDIKRGKAFGLGSASLLKTLEESAKFEKDPNVRAMSAAILHGLNERDDKKRAALLTDYNAIWQLSQTEPKFIFSEKIKNHLAETMAKPIDADADWQRERKVNAALCLDKLLNPPDGRYMEINRALAASVSPTQPAFNNKIVDALLPDKLAELSKVDPSIANLFRQQLISSIKVPEYQVQEKPISDLISKMRQVVFDTNPMTEQNKDKRTQLAADLANKYSALLDKNRREEFAQFSPELREAAIYGLADMGDGRPETKALLRQFVTAAPEIKIGGETIKAGETDPRVRVAALHALERLKDKELHNIAVELIDRETDPQTAQMLRNLKFANTRIDVDSREYSDMYEKALAKLFNPANQARYDFLKDFKEKKWLDETFDMSKEALLRDGNAAANKSWTTWRFFHGHKSAAAAEITEIEAVEATRAASWDRLVAMAEGDGQDAARAKMALAWIARNPLYMGISEEGVRYAGKSFNENVASGVYDTRKNADYSLKAAERLADLCKPGAAQRDISAHAIRLTLEHGVDTSSNVQLQMLGGLKQLRELHPDDKKAMEKNPNFKPAHFAISLEQHATTLANALNLNLEINKPTDNQSGVFQKALIDELHRVRHRAILPVLDALGEKSKFPEVKESAKKMRTELQESVQKMWDETQADTQSSEIQRAAKMKAALEEKKLGTNGTYDERSAENTVQEMFSAYKNYDLKPADKGLPYLNLAMSESAERVRIAAAGIVMRTNLPANDQNKLKAIKVLAEVATSPAAKEGHRKDANELLKTVDTVTLAKTYGEQALASDDKSPLAIEQLKKLVGDTPVIGDMPDGTQIRIRNFNSNVVVEQMKDGKVVKSAVPEGKALSEFLLKDAGRYGVAVKERYLAAREALQNDALAKSTDAQKIEALKHIAQFVDSASLDENLRLEAAKILGAEDRFSKEEGVKARIKAFNTIVELAAHGTETLEEARRIIGKDGAAQAQSVLTKELADMNQSSGRPNAKRVEESLKLALDLYTAGDTASESRLLSATTHASKMLNADSAIVAAAATAIDRLATNKLTPVSGKDDPRVPALIGALDSPSATLRLSAAWALTEKSLPRDLMDTKTREKAFGAIKSHIEETIAKAADTEKAGDRKAAAALWAKAEETYAHIGVSSNEYSHSYATMQRMSCELGANHKDLAPLYDKLAKLAADGHDQKQSEFFMRKAKAARGEGGAIADVKTESMARAKPPAQAPTTADAQALARDVQKAKQLSDQAIATNDKEKLQRVEKTLKTLADTYRSTEGATSANLAGVLSTLGNVQMTAGNQEAGEKSWREAVSIYEKTGKSDIPEDAIKTTLGLTRYYSNAGNTAAFEKYKGKMLDMSKMSGTRTVQLTSSDALLDLVDVMTSRQATKEMMDEAETCMQQALDLRIKNTGANSTETALAQQAMADFYSRNHANANGVKAKALYEQSLATLETTTGRSPEWGAAMAKLAHYRANSGDSRGASAGFNQALDAMMLTGAPPQQLNEIMTAYAQHLQHYEGFKEADLFRQNPGAYVQLKKQILLSGPAGSGPSGSGPN